MSEGVRQLLDLYTALYDIVKTCKAPNPYVVIALAAMVTLIEIEHESDIIGKQV